MSSLEMIGRVWLSALPKGVSKIVLLCFCAHLNDSAKLSWPSVARVARLCGMGERTVQKHIRALERAGILVARLRRTGRATRYAIALDGLRPLPCAAPAWQVLPCAPADHAALDAIATVPTPAQFAPSPADFDVPPPQLLTPTPAESAPITVLNLKENSKTPNAPALPAARVRIDQVNPQVMADFAAVRATKRKGPVTATVVQDLCEQAALAGITLEQAMKTCCTRNWARFEAGWLQPLPGAGAGAGGATVAAPALYVSPPTLPAAPAVAAAGRERLAALRQAAIDAGLGSAKGCGWAHAAIEKHRAGQPVRRAVLLDACAALKLKPASLSLHAAHLH
ncbi:biotin operon repressor [Polaromonas sp. CG_9.5]|uniref:helix-turn-helix domain-containing protein n=1 Tax=Polaromonas sp. CG_9.5 TaxID=3071705 RepID=UPI002DF96ADA|nr:biotin operon repressor [Polaromonas sp. CG_9.5]